MTDAASSTQTSGPIVNADGVSPGAPRHRRLRRRVLVTIVLLIAAVAGFVTFECLQIMYMPGHSYAVTPPALTSDEVQIRDNLRRHVEHLATDIGIRHYTVPAKYREAMQYVMDQFRAAGYESTTANPWRINDEAEVGNVVAELRGSSHADEVFVLGAHYDTVRVAPGANDNASGVAAMLEVARMLKRSPPPARSIRFVAFYNEEHNSGGPCGSEQYAKSCRDRNDNITGMIALDEIGYYTDAPDTQHYPFPFNLFYPGQGNFLAFVGNSNSRALTRDTIYAFRSSGATIPTRGAAVPPMFEDAGRSDHVWFWRNGYPALMLTDTANFRYAHYHRATDTAEKLDYDRLARVTGGLVRVMTSK